MGFASGADGVGNLVVGTALAAGAVLTSEACVSIAGCVIPVGLGAGSAVAFDTAAAQLNGAIDGYEQQTGGGYVATRVFRVDANTGELIYVAAQVSGGLLTGGIVGARNLPNATSSGTILAGRRTDQLDNARVRELGINHEQGGKTDLAEGIGGAHYESATGRALIRSETEGVDFYDGDIAISLKGPLVNKNTGEPINISDNTVDGLASAVAKDAKFNTASDAIVIDTSGMNAAQRARLRDKIDAALDGAEKEIIYLE